MSYTTKNSKPLVLRIFNDAYNKGFMEGIFDTNKWDITMIVIKLKINEELTREIEIVFRNGIYKFYIEDYSLINRENLSNYEDTESEYGSNDTAFKFTTMKELEEIWDNLKEVKISDIVLHLKKGDKSKNISFLIKKRGINTKHDRAIKKLLNLYKSLGKFVPKIMNEAKWAKLRREAKVEGHPNMLLLQGEFDQGNKKIYQFGKEKYSKKKYSKDFIKDLLRFAKKKGRAIKLKNNKGKDPKKLKAYDTGYIIAVRLNGKIFKFRYMKGRNQGFRFSVKINGKIYNFNSKGPGRVTLYRNLKKSSKEKRSVKKVKRSKKAKTTTRKRRTTGGSKRVSTKRKSPEQSATLYKIGTTKTGNDGNRWVVKKASNGVKRWVKK